MSSRQQSAGGRQPDGALVFAGTSFLGRHLCDRLRTAGVPVWATSRTPQTGTIACDLERAADIDAVVADVRPRWVFQCAGLTAKAAPDEMDRLHRDAASHLLAAVARHVPAAVVLLVGSAAEYGPAPPEQLPIREETPAVPGSPYGWSKLAQTQLAERMAGEHGLRVHVVRPFNLLGPGLGPHYLAAALCDRLRQARRDGLRGPLPVVNGRATRDWVDVRDAADAAVRLALDAPPEPGRLGLFNLATGLETPVLALADHLCRLAGDFHAVDRGPADSRSAIDRSCGDAARLRAATGWAPRFDWRQSLHDLWAAAV